VPAACLIEQTARGISGADAVRTAQVTNGASASTNTHSFSQHLFQAGAALTAAVTATTAAGECRDGRKRAHRSCSRAAADTDGHRRSGL
jgi:hypothetical protein